ncbi:hypothetical protein AGLY_015568, partial [Aphis glycines]
VTKSLFFLKNIYDLPSLFHVFTIIIFDQIELNNEKKTGIVLGTGIILILSSFKFTCSHVYFILYLNGVHSHNRSYNDRYHILFKYTLDLYDGNIEQYLKQNVLYINMIRLLDVFLTIIIILRLFKVKINVHCTIFYLVKKLQILDVYLKCCHITRMYHYHPIAVITHGNNIKIFIISSLKTFLYTLSSYSRTISTTIGKTITTKVGVWQRLFNSSIIKFQMSNDSKQTLLKLLILKYENLQYIFEHSVYYTSTLALRAMIH